MITVIQAYEKIKRQVAFISTQLRFSKFKNKFGRKLALSVEDAISLALFKHRQGIETKKSVYQIFQPACSYKTLVVSLNRWASLAAAALTLMLQANRGQQHLVKHTDTTDIPVCLLKNSDHHQTMRQFASKWHTGNHYYYGLKLHLTSDLKRNVLAVRFTSANADDRKTLLELNKDLMGIFVADSGYVSDKLQSAFYREGRRLLITKPYKTMKKLATAFELWLYDTRMLIELNFRNLKMFYGLITSLPRSVDGYLANYIYSLLAYLVA